MHPGVSETNAQHSGSHSEAFANSQTTTNKSYYKRNKERILANRKRRYYENAEVEKLGSRARSKAKYQNDTEPQKTAACARSKAKYKNDPEPQKTAARAQSKAKYRINLEAQKVAARVRYARNPKIKIGHSNAYLIYARNKQSIHAKKKGQIFTV